jgi:hypothetical protein
MQARYLSGLYSLDDFGPRLRTPAGRVGMDGADRGIGLSDGGNGLEDRLRENFPRVEVSILDFYHPAEFAGRGVAPEQQRLPPPDAGPDSTWPDGLDPARCPGLDGDRRAPREIDAEGRPKGLAPRLPPDGVDPCRLSQSVGTIRQARTGLPTTARPATRSGRVDRGRWHRSFETGPELSWD